MFNRITFGPGMQKNPLNFPLKLPLRVQYALAIGLIVLALALRWFLNPWLGNRVPFITVFATLMALVLLVRPGPFLAATVLGGIGTWRLFLMDQFRAEANLSRALIPVTLLAFAILVAMTVAWLSRRAQEQQRVINQAYTESSSELNDLFEHAAMCIHWVDADGIILRANRAELDFLGYAHDEYVGRSITEFHVDAQALNDLWTRLLGGEELHEYPAQLRCKDGSVRDVLVNSNVRFVAGRFIHSRCFTVDVTERKRVERNMRFLDQISQDLIDLTSVPSLVQCLGARLGRFMGVSSCAFIDIDEIKQTAVIHDEWRRPGQPSLVGSYALPQFVTDEFFQIMSAGKAVVVCDVKNDARILHREGFESLGIAAFINLPLMRNHAWRFTLGVYHIEPYIWRDDQISLMTEIGHRLWSKIERVRAENALRESEEKLRAIYHGTHEYIGLLTPDGTLLEANRASLEFAHTQREDEVGRPFWDTVWFRHTPGAPEHVRAMIARAAKGELVRFEAPLKRPNGEASTFGITYYPIRNADDEVVLIVSEGRDLSEHRLAEAAQRTSEERYRTLFNSMQQGFCIIRLIYDTDDRPVDFWLLEINPAFEVQTGLKGVVGKRASEITPAHDLYWCEFYGHVARTGEPGRQVNYSTAVKCWFEVYAFRVGDEGDYKIAVFFTDVTERRRQEETLKDADRRKDEFLAMLAHELRNPLAPIRNGLELLRLSEQNPAAIEQARKMMDRQLSQLVRLVDDLLDVSRISRNRLELRKQQIALNEVLHSAIETSMPLIQSLGHELIVDLPDTPVLLDADSTRLAQVFSNLLNNAAKYTHGKGRIGLTAKLCAAPDAEAIAHAQTSASSPVQEIIVTVEDNGLGIAAEMLPRIFEMFLQVDDSLERAQGGLGIGLTLVQRLVEMHGGSVTAESDGPGRGSRFSVRLPVLASAMPSAIEAQETLKAGGPRRILIVDDNEDAATSLAMVLQLSGNMTHTAHDGAAALQEAEAFRPDLILLDIGLPKLNGYEVATKMREQPWGKRIVLVALTGWGQEEDRRKSAAAGFDAHMVKPVDLAVLMKLIEGMEGDAGTSTA